MLAPCLVWELFVTSAVHSETSIAFLHIGFFFTLPSFRPQARIPYLAFNLKTTNFNPLLRFVV